MVILGFASLRSGFLLRHYFEEEFGNVGGGDAANSFQIDENAALTLYYCGATLYSLEVATGYSHPVSFANKVLFVVGDNLDVGIARLADSYKAVHFVVAYGEGRVQTVFGS